MGGIDGAAAHGISLLLSFGLGFEGSAQDLFSFPCSYHDLAVTAAVSSVHCMHIVDNLGWDMSWAQGEVSRDVHQ